MSKMNIINKTGNSITDFITNAFLPFINVLAAAGILKGILLILSLINIIPAISDTYKVLDSISNSMFYFLPVFLAMNIAKYFDANIYVNALIALSLVSPGMIGLLSSVQPLTLLEISVKNISYGNMLFPIFISTIISCLLEKGIDKFIPVLLKLFITPALTLAIMVPLILILFGPMGELIGKYLTYAFTALYNFNPVLCAAIIAPAYLILCIFGLHWFLVPIMLNNIAQTGWDPVMGMCSIPAWVCMGVSLNLIWRSRSQLSKGKAVSAAFSAIFGIVEPTLFPILIALKKPLVMVTAINIILGAVVGIFDIAASGFLPPGPSATALFIGHGAFTLLAIGFCGAATGFIGMCLLDYREIPSTEEA